MKHVLSRVGLRMLAAVGLCALPGSSLSEARSARGVPIARVFGFPVGLDGTAAGYYDAQPFGENGHLGEDWNGVGGGNSDFGDAVVAVAHGVVVSAEDRGGGWGRVVRVVHNYGSRRAPRWVESLYAHLDVIDVRPGAVVRRGQRLGTIGTAHGRYLAHLHFELRGRVGMPLGRGYGHPAPGYLNPTAFIRQRRARGAQMSSCDTATTTARRCEAGGRLRKSGRRRR